MTAPTIPLTSAVMLLAAAVERIPRPEVPYVVAVGTVLYAAFLVVAARSGRRRRPPTDRPPPP